MSVYSVVSCVKHCSESDCSVVCMCVSACPCMCVCYTETETQRDIDTDTERETVSDRGTGEVREEREGREANKQV